jgi:hypothetical protein
MMMGRAGGDLANAMPSELPNSGACFNHAGYGVEGWAAKFWGSNLPRLQSIKSAVDPDGRFNCFHCVGYQYLGAGKGQYYGTGDDDSGGGGGGDSVSVSIPTAAVAGGAAGGAVVLLVLAAACYYYMKKKSSAVGPKVAEV